MDHALARRIASLLVLSCGVALGLAGPAIVRAQEVSQGDFLRIAFTGDGTTPSAMQLFQDQQRDLPKPRFGAGAGDGGELSYAIDFPLPPALLEPSFSIGYSANGGHHGYLSRGWSVLAGMTITRLRGAEASHAYADLATEADVFRVSGGGLDGVLFLSGGQWRFASSSTDRASATFDGVVWTVRSGGRTTTLQADNTVPWQLSTELPVSFRAQRVRDESGNTLDYEWMGSRLEAIRYGGATGSTG